MTTAEMDNLQNRKKGRVKFAFVKFANLKELLKLLKSEKTAAHKPDRGEEDQFLSICHVA